MEENKVKDSIASFQSIHNEILTEYQKLPL